MSFYVINAQNYNLIIFNVIFLFVVYSQFHIAFSKNVAGAGIVAGGPFYCAQGSMMKALTQCMSTAAGMNVDTLVSFTKGLSDKDIDSLDNFKNQKLYLFSGTSDTIGTLSSCFMYQKQTLG